MENKFSIFNFQLSILLLILCSSFPAIAQEEYAGATEWHKYYEPLESPGVMAYVEDCFKEAQKLFGKPVIQVNEIHLRQSIERKDLQTFSRAEILDWQALAEIIYKGRSLKGTVPSPYQYLWERLDIHAKKSIEKLVKGEALDHVGRLRIISSFNRMVTANDFYRKDLFSKIVPQKRGFSLSRIFGSKNAQTERLNRKVFTKLFAGYVAPAPRLKRIAEGVELCECTDEYKGIFTIYVPSSPRKDEFYLETAHESAHLLNAKYFDWYVEGMNNVFAQHMANKVKRSWTPWARLFERGKNSHPYAISYFMMRDIMLKVGGHMSTFLQHGVTWGRHNDKMRIDINSWLATLPNDLRFKVMDIINHYAPKLTANKDRRNAFYLPGS